MRLSGSILHALIVAVMSFLYPIPDNSKSTWEIKPPAPNGNVSDAGIHSNDQNLTGPSNFILVELPDSPAFDPINVEPPEEIKLSPKRDDAISSKDDGLQSPLSQNNSVVESEISGISPPLVLGSARYTGYVYDPRLRYHENVISEHPEQPSRISKIHEQIVNTGLVKRLIHIPLRNATSEELELAHEKGYLAWLKSTSAMPPNEYERESIYYNQYTSGCAQLACGGVLDLAQYIANGLLRNGMAVVRPPGHHAECNKAMGFCFLNYVSIAAKFLQKHCNMKKILIVDWDIHHGNGTQNMFISDPSVLYVSLHRYDHGTFFPSDAEANYTSMGTGAGIGKTVNIPWSDEEMGDAEYLYAFHKVVLPIAYEFNPDFIIVSCGFDAAEGDPIGDYHLSPECFGHMTYALMALAQGRIMLSLEGGYSLDALPLCAEMCMKALIGEPPHPLVVPISPNLSCVYTIDNLVIPTQRKYWSCFGEQDTSMMKLLSGFKAKYPNMFVAYSDICGKYWSQLMTSQYQLVRIPLPEEINCGFFMSPDVIFRQDPMVVLIHNLGSVILPSQDHRLSKSTIMLPHLIYIEKAISKNFLIIDLAIQDISEHSPMECDSQEKSKSANKSLSYIWENFLSLGMSKNLYLLGFGTECTSSITALISKSDNIGKFVKHCYLFPEELPRPVTYDKSAWFIDHSTVFIPSMEEVYSVIPFSRAFGKCVSSGVESQTPHSAAGISCIPHVEFVFEDIEKYSSPKP